MAFKILDLHSCETGSQNAYFTLRRQKHYLHCSYGDLFGHWSPSFLPILGLFSIKRNYSQTAMPKICPCCYPDLSILWESNSLPGWQLCSENWSSKRHLLWLMKVIRLARILCVWSKQWFYKVALNATWAMPKCRARLLSWIFPNTVDFMLLHGLQLQLTGVFRL